MANGRPESLVGVAATAVLAAIHLACTAVPPGSVVALDAIEPRSPFGAVSTGYAEATRAATLVLEGGGNAVDAAVTAAFVAGAADPGSSSLGGTTYLLITTADGHRVAIDGSSVVPMFVDLEKLAELKEQEDVFGCPTVAVPGSLAALVHALERYGTASLEETIHPAVEMAERGYLVTDTHRASIEKYLETILKTESMRLLLLKDGQGLPDVGSRIRQPDLAATLRRIGRNGPDEFYRGEIADRIDADMIRRGGFVRQADLAAYRVVERRPARIVYRDVEVLSFPWPGGGGVVAEGLNILENFPQQALREDGPDRLQLMIEAFRIALVDHYRVTNDPRIAQEADELEHTTEAFAAERAGLIRFDRALTEDDIPPIDRYYRSPGGTTQISVVDRWGNVVSLTQTLGRFFGGKAMTAGLGVVYNSFLEGFDPARPEGIVPRSPCPTDMSPTIVLRDGRLVVALGSAGSERIPAVVGTVISNLVDRGMPLRDAVLAPRVVYAASDDVDIAVEIRPPVTAAEVEVLEARGYGPIERVVLPATRRDFVKLGAVNAVSWNEALLSYCAVGDPRREGIALAVRN